MAFRPRRAGHFASRASASLGIIVWSLVAAYRGRKIDLVEPRRRFREIFVAGAGSYVLLVVASEILLNGRMAAQELELINAAAIVATGRRSPSRQGSERPGHGRRRRSGRRQGLTHR